MHYYTVCVLLSLTSLCVIVWRSICISAKGWVIFHCEYIQPHLFSFLCCWMFRLLPCPGYLKQCYCEHTGSVQFSLVAQSCPTLCDPMDWGMSDFPVHQQLLKVAQTHVYRAGDAIQPSHLLSSPLLLPSIFLRIRVFSNESALCIIRWPKYWTFSLSISPSNEYSGLISFRMDWLDLLAVQVTVNSLLKHHNSKASILQHSTFFIV